MVMVVWCGVAMDRQQRVVNQSVSIEHPKVFGILDHKDNLINEADQVSISLQQLLLRKRQLL
jgi:hypothetical protein